MFCRFCGKPISIEDRFCSHCGEVVYPDNEIKKIDIKAYTDEMSFSSDDLKQLQAFLKDAEPSLDETEKIVFNSSQKSSPIEENLVFNDGHDPELTIFMPDEIMQEELSLHRESSFSYKRLFIRLLIIGIGIGVTLGMIANFGLDIL